MLELILKPWPWYVAGPLIGLIVPALLILGNKSFGISSSFRHVCAACVPSNIPFFKYDWKKERWNLFFVAGIMAGGFIAVNLLTTSTSVTINSSLATSLHEKGITDFSGLVPADLFNWNSLFKLKGFNIMVVG